MSLKRALIRTTLGLAAFSAAATAVIGAAHTPWGRPLLKLPLLSALASHAGCPVGAIEPAAFERVRATKLKSEVGGDAARQHPALVFTLGETRRTDVERWTKTQNAACKAGFVASVLECSDVAAPGAPTIAKLRLQFDEQERLVSVDLFRSTGSPEALVGRFVELGRQLDERVGPATSSVGTPSLAFVTQAPLQTVVRQYNYRDYVAKATLLNFGKRGLRLREQYQWLAPGVKRAPA
jgi:hypothetical protein